MTPDRAKVKRQRLQAQEHDPFMSEREWIPLWLAGPLLALGAVVGLIGICALAAELYLRLVRF